MQHTTSNTTTTEVQYIARNGIIYTMGFSCVEALAVGLTIESKITMTIKEIHAGLAYPEYADYSFSTVPPAEGEFTIAFIAPSPLGGFIYGRFKKYL